VELGFSPPHVLGESLGVEPVRDLGLVRRHGVGRKRRARQTGTCAIVTRVAWAAPGMAWIGCAARRCLVAFVSFVVY